MNYNPTPKAEFLLDPKSVQDHHVLVMNEILRKHLNVALLEYQRRQSALNAVDLGSCASCYLREKGATEFVALFLNLAETVDLPITSDTLNLPSNVKPLK